MKKKVTSFLLALFIVLVNWLPNTVLAQNQTPKSWDDVITKINLKNAEGGPLGEVRQWQTFRVDMDFTLPDNSVKEGDTTTIKLPEELSVTGSTGNFEIKDSEGHIVANAKINEESNTVTLTYTNYPENRSGVHGSLFFYSRVNHIKVTEKKKIDVHFTVGNKVISGGSIDWQGATQENGSFLDKHSWTYSADNSHLEHRISVNRKGQDIQNGYVEDFIQGEKIDYVRESLIVYKGKWKWNQDKADYDFETSVDVTAQMAIQWAADGKSFKVSFGDLKASEGLKIEYLTKIGYKPVEGEMFTNKAKLSGENIAPDNTTSEHRYVMGGGSAEGYIYVIKIKKIGEKGDALKGAKFKLIRDRNQAIIGEYVSDAQGEIVFKDLIRDDYTLVETEAPKGYQLDPTEIKISANDFGADKLIEKKITNKKIVEKISIPVEKIWKGKALEKIKIYLKADNEVVKEIELSEKMDGSILSQIYQK